MVLQTIEDVRAYAYRIARARRVSHHDAEEIAQDIALEWTARPPRTFYSSLLASRVESRRIDRWHKRRVETAAQELLARYPEDVSSAGHHPVLNVPALLASLPDDERQVVAMRLDDMSWKTVSSLTRLPRATCVRKWARAMRRFRNAVSGSDMSRTIPGLPGECDA